MSLVAQASGLGMGVVAEGDLQLTQMFTNHQLRLQEVFDQPLHLLDQFEETLVTLHQ